MWGKSESLPFRTGGFDGDGTDIDGFVVFLVGLDDTPCDFRVLADADAFEGDDAAFWWTYLVPFVFEDRFDFEGGNLPSETVFREFFQTLFTVLYTESFRSDAVGFYRVIGFEEDGFGMER